MTCSGCGKRTDGQPVAMIYSAIDGQDDKRKFTGVVCCTVCVLALPDGKWIADELKHV